MTIRGAALALLLALSGALPGAAQENLNDLEMAHVAVVASEIDIAYAHLALALSDNPEVRTFAEVMIRDHTAVNGQVVELARRLGVKAQDNDFSRQLLEDAEGIRDELSQLRGAAFDRRYAANELSYHRAVNGIVAEVFIPAIENPEVEDAFRTALSIFRGHENHAEEMARRVGAEMD